jgi:tetratricopeptide (TPR) repeat protein
MGNRNHCIWALGLSQSDDPMACEPPAESHTPFPRVIFFLFLFITIIYGNSLKAEWHLDDYANILYNTNLQIENFAPSTLYRAIRMPYTSGERISRPLARLSFALNWYWHGHDLSGYHLFNICVHLLAAVLLYLTILELLSQSPVLKNRYVGNRQFIALLATVLWAANPIQTQAITYIVQRMASMAAMFFILAFYLYLRGRASATKKQRSLCWLSAGAAFIAAMASKENTALLPLAVILTEVVFFQDLGRPEIRRRWLWIAGIAVIAFFIGTSLLFLKGDLSTILKGYDVRPFTPIERMLTQPRVLWLYISLLFYPTPSRLTPEHEIDISTNLIQPWTTLPAILGLISLVAVSIMVMRRRPLLSFAILFFLLNHAIESSFIPLELVFEHRNYLPSMFFFLPVAAGFKQLLDYYRDRRKSMYAILVGFGILLMVGWGMGTHIRNMDWSTEETLWRDAISKAPKSYRPIHNLAWGYFERTGQLDKAYKLYQNAYDLQMHTRMHAALPLNNMANIHFIRGEYPQAAELWQKALSYAPQNPDYIYRYAQTLTRIGHYDQAMVYADRLIEIGKHQSDAKSLEGRLLLLQNQPQKALSILREVYRRTPQHPLSSYRLALTFVALGHYTQAEVLLRQALGLDPENLGTIIWLAKLNYLAKDQKDFSRFLHKAATSFSLSRIKAVLEKGGEGIILKGSERLAVDEAIAAWLETHYLLADAYSRATLH